jgi:hypothetical protein
LFVFLNSHGLVEPCCQWLRSPSQEYVLCLASVASWQRLLQMCRFRACLGRFSTCARKKKSWSGKYLDYPRYILFFFNSFIHMCIHCLGHSLPYIPSLPGRTFSALFSNCVEEKT